MKYEKFLVSIFRTEVVVNSVNTPSRDENETLREMFGLKQSKQ